VDKITLTGAVVGWALTVVLFFQWRRVAKQANERDFWQKMAGIYANRAQKYKDLVTKKEVEIRVLETKIASDYSDRELVDKLNGIVKLPKD
jgi:hypothetical protein